LNLIKRIEEPKDMFTKTNRNDPLVESIKNVMEQNDLLRRVETAVNEHFGVVSKKALPHEYHAEYDAIFEETKKCAMAEESDKDKKVATPEHHRAEAIRIHKQIKMSGKLPHLVAKKKEHEEAYRKMTGNKVKYPDDLNEKVKMTKDQMAKLDGDPKFTGNDLAHLRAGTHKKKAAAGTLEEKASEEQKAKVAKVMHKWKQGKEHIGKSEKTVPVSKKGQKQAVAIALSQAGLSKKQKMDEETSIDSIMEEIRSNLEEQLVAVYESGDESAFADFIGSLTEEQIEILGLNEQAGSGASFTDKIMGVAKGAFRAATGGATQSTMGSSQNTQTPTGGGISANAGRQSVSTGMVAGPSGTRVSPEQSAKLAAQRKEAPQPKPPGSPGVTSGETTTYGRDKSKAMPPASGGKAKVIAPTTSTQTQKSAAPVSVSRPAQRPGMATKPGTTAPRPAQKPGMARPGVSSAPVRRVPGAAAAAAQKRIGYQTKAANVSPGQMMSMREETEAPKPIKESFEQFLRNKFLKG
jgi:hypothetical protein